MVMPRRRRWNKQKPTAIFQPNVENPLILERKPVNRRDYGDIPSCNVASDSWGISTSGIAGAAVFCASLLPLHAASSAKAARPVAFQGAGIGIRLLFVIMLRPCQSGDEGARMERRKEQGPTSPLTFWIIGATARFKALPASAASAMTVRPAASAGAEREMERCSTP